MPVLSRQSLEILISGAHPMIRSNDHTRLVRDLQTASIDCSLGTRAYCVPSSRLPRPGERVASLIDSSFYNWELKSEGSFLHRGSTYIIPIEMELSLAEGYFGECSPKSTIGRNDAFARVLLDDHSRFDHVPSGYEGGMYLQVTPVSYPVEVSPGLALTQLRVKTNNGRRTQLTDDEIKMLHAKHGIVRDEKGVALPHRDLKVEGDGIYLHLDLSGPVVGLEALSHPREVVNLAKKEAYDPHKFWRPVFANDDGTCTLSAGKFYLLRTKERVLIPPECCAWMQPYDVGSGEFRSHYAGFFDNGFGGSEGTVGVLEVRLHEESCEFWDGQPICRFVYEWTDEVPSVLYGKGLGSSYTQSGPSLAKNFKNRYEAWNHDFWRR